MPNDIERTGETDSFGGTLPVPEDADDDVVQIHPRKWRLGKVISERYVLERHLGRGAMGEVYLARDRLLKKQIAIKVLKPALAESRETVRRFLREVALAQSVTHPHVVRIYDTGEFDGLPFFTMELLQGQRLDELIQASSATHAGLLVREIREISLEILGAMEAAHQAGVIHRDLKPSNVMLTHRGAIVMDFGVAGIDSVPVPDARALTTTELRSIVRTEAGTIFGSPAYMAPELWEGAPATIQTDIYAFGVMLYQMLAGRLPYEAASPSALLEKLRNSQPPSVRSVRRDTPWNLVMLVRSCMNADPERRPASAASAATLLMPWRRRALTWLAAAVTTGLGLWALASMFRPTPTWEAQGLPDRVAQADLEAAVRAFDVGDDSSALRYLERLNTRAPEAAAVSFWRATLHHQLGDDVGRKAVCAQSSTREGSERWQALAETACARAYGLPLEVLGMLEGVPGAAGLEALPLAIDESLIPRLEGSRVHTQNVQKETRRVARLLERVPEEWASGWMIPTHWALARAHLDIAAGRLTEAREALMAQVEQGGEQPIVRERAAWFELQTGNLDRAQEFAESLLPDHPRMWVRLQLEQGRLEEAWAILDDVDADAVRAGLRTMWCGYAFRFEASTPPDRCSSLAPGLVRTLWRLSNDESLDRAAMTPLEQTLVRRQRELDSGECRRERLGPILSHAQAPFEGYLPELELTAALCSADPSHADLKAARRIALAIVAVMPQDPWATLLHAQVDEAYGDDHLAQAKRLAVAERWQHADPELPLVKRLRSRLGLESRAASAPAIPPLTSPNVDAIEPLGAEDQPDTSRGASDLP